MWSYFLMALFKDICLMYPFDGSAAEYQKQDKVKQEEATPDQKGNVYDPDGFMGRMKSQEEPCFGGYPPDYKGGHVPSETGIEEEVLHAVSLAGGPCSDKDHAAVDYGNHIDPEPLFSGKQGTKPKSE